MKDSLGDRMKDNYENRYRMKLIRRTPVIIRLDGKAFHTVTKKCDKPYDIRFIRTMLMTTRHLMENIQGAKCAYVQSDEISILLSDYDKIGTDAWFDYNLQKIVSVSASMASVYFSKEWGSDGLFDCRAFNIPKEDVTNYFVWRQNDWMRNSVQMLGQYHFSHKELHKKKTIEVQDMLYGIGVKWHKERPIILNGAFVYRGECGVEVLYNVVFNKHRESIDKYLFVEEDEL